ncbi:MAG TPA: saccharopine dehydrogenase NADP-binding domain-containing protein [Caulobacteraceae bacterium]|nr:saccharopine dehydrogenase NADP-binding domain-containing protein [Caulobacteraceae bacterium]
MAQYDIVAYGATGYTGRLVAAHLLKTYGAAGDLAWAMAGRSRAKLEEVRGEIGAPDTLPVVVADAQDPASLAAMAKSAKAVITTVGPYQLYGDSLVAACAEAGCDYVDLTGESHWIAKMIAANEASAKISGARIVFSCGFDSIPFDLGVLFAEEEAKRRFGAAAPRVRARVRGMQGGLSGGTLASGMASMAAMQKDPSIGAQMADPFALTPGFAGPKQPDGETAYEDKAAGSWVAPWMMAAINSKAVHRSNMLLGFPWGRDLQYDEMLMVDGPPAEDGPPPGGFAFGQAPMPQPGEGPTKEERENGFYDILVMAEAGDGRTVRCSVKGDMDPGYGSTAKMLGESAVCLVRDVPRTRTPGGCWTTASAMGDALIARLQKNAGLTFAVEG